MEPQEYFEGLKKEVRTVTEEELRAMFKTVEAELVRAHAIGQKTIVERLIFARKNLAREIEAYAAGLSRYVYKAAVAKFIDEVTPKHSVKIIELERYPRLIPEENLAEIRRVQALNIFDAFCVVFTDLTNEELETPEDKAFRDRNRDPIVFGYHRKEMSSLRSDRYYLVTDWEDEYCDLTFDRMIQKMSANDYGEISLDDRAEIQRIIDDAGSEMEPDRSVTPAEVIIDTVEVPTYAERFKSGLSTLRSYITNHGRN